MIKLTALDKREFYLNAELVEQIESVPETVITLTNGKKLLVRNTVEEVVEKITKYKQQIFNFMVRELEVQE